LVAQRGKRLLLEVGLYDERNQRWGTLVTKPD
jgi:hypothetical protein